MEVFEAAGNALGIVFSVERLVSIMVGTFIGLLMGVIPGLGGVVGVSLLLPFLFGMDPATGLGLMVGLIAVGSTSDTFPAVLIGVPGSGGSQATVMDGYPLARLGQAERALGAAFTASVVGGLLGAVFMFGLIFVGRPLILAFTTPELFMLCVVGLSMVAVLSRGAVLPGILSALIGLVLGFVGTAPQASQYRYTFDNVYLRNGVPISVIALSIFAIPEILQLLLEGKSVSRSGKLSGGGILAGMREAFSHKFLIFRSAFVGTGVGVVPGLGGNVIDWITYAMARATSKNSENFGKGDIRGVIAPESANNAKEGGTLVPTLFFGIPGSGSSAVVLAGLLILGITPGPSMLTRNLDLTLSVVWTLSVANVMAVIVCLSLAKYIARISVIPGVQIAPWLLVIMTAAVFQSTKSWGDVMLMFGLGFIGFVMKQAAFPRAPMLIGFVLVIATERYLHISMSRYGTSFLSRPIVMILIGLTVLLVTVSVGNDFAKVFRKQKRHPSPVSKEVSPSDS